MSIIRRTLLLPCCIYLTAYLAAAHMDESEHDGGIEPAVLLPQTGERGVRSTTYYDWQHEDGLHASEQHFCCTPRYSGSQKIVDCFGLGFEQNVVKFVDSPSVQQYPAPNWPDVVFNFTSALKHAFHLHGQRVTMSYGVTCGNPYGGSAGGSPLTKEVLLSLVDSGSIPGNAPGIGDVEWASFKSLTELDADIPVQSLPFFSLPPTGLSMDADSPYWRGGSPENMFEEDMRFGSSLGYFRLGPSGEGSNNFVVGAPGFNGGKGTVMVGELQQDCLQPEYLFPTTSGSSPRYPIPNHLIDDYQVAGIGSAVVAHDFDGNGADDLAIGAADSDGGGLVFLVLFSDGLVPCTTTRYGIGQRDSPGLTDTAFSCGGACQFGSSLALGDVNGDGTVDILVGAPKANGGAGAVVALLLDGTGFSPTQYVWQAGNGLPASFPAGNINLGVSLAFHPDLTGSHGGDIFVGAPRASSGEGRVFVLYLSKDGSGYVHDYKQLKCEWTRCTNDAITSFGQSLHLTVADPNHHVDDVPTLVVGFHEYPSTTKKQQGIVVVPLNHDGKWSGDEPFFFTYEGSWFGADPGPTVENWVPPRRTQDRGHFGAAVIMYDVDQDGADDFVIGDPGHPGIRGTDGGAFHVILRSSDKYNAWPVQSMTFANSSLHFMTSDNVWGNGEGFGASLTHAQFGGDDVHLYVGAPYSDNEFSYHGGQSDSGSIYSYRFNQRNNVLSRSIEQVAVLKDDLCMPDKNPFHPSALDARRGYASTAFTVPLPGYQDRHTLVTSDLRRPNEGHIEVFQFNSESVPGKDRYREMQATEHWSIPADSILGYKPDSLFPTTLAHVQNQDIQDQYDLVLGFEHTGKWWMVFVPLAWQSAPEPWPQKPFDFGPTVSHGCSDGNILASPDEGCGVSLAGGWFDNAGTNHPAIFGGTKNFADNTWFVFTVDAAGSFQQFQRGGDARPASDKCGTSIATVDWFPRGGAPPKKQSNVIVGCPGFNSGQGGFIIYVLDDAGALRETHACREGSECDLFLDSATVDRIGLGKAVTAFKWGNNAHIFVSAESSNVLYAFEVMDECAGCGMQWVGATVLKGPEYSAPPMITNPPRAASFGTSVAFGGSSRFFPGYMIGAPKAQAVWCDRNPARCGFGLVHRFSSVASFIPFRHSPLSPGVNMQTAALQNPVPDPSYLPSDQWGWGSAVAVGGWDASTNFVAVGVSDFVFGGSSYGNVYVVNFIDGNGDEIVSASSALSQYFFPVNNFFGPLTAGGGFGSAVALADYNFDGVLDIFVGAPFGTEVCSGVKRGTVYRYQSQNIAGKWQASNNLMRQLDATPCGMGRTNNDEFGSSIAYLGVHESFHRFAVGAPADSCTLGVACGTVHIFGWDGSDEPIDSVQITYGALGGILDTWFEKNGRFGTALAATDVSFDGMVDLLITSTGYNNFDGAVFVLVLAPDEPSSTPLGNIMLSKSQFEVPIGINVPATGSSMCPDNFGSSIAAGDYNFDGVLDIAVGCAAYSQVLMYSGMWPNVTRLRGTGWDLSHCPRKWV